MRGRAGTSRSSSASAFALALLLAGCSNDQPAPGSTSGSATGSGSADPCPADTDTHVTKAMDATDAYFTKLADTMKPWTAETSCDAIKAALEPSMADGDAYLKVIESSKAWSKDLSEACRDSLDQRWAGERAKLMEQKFRAIVDGGLAHVKRCEAHPGMMEVASRAIRLMKKRK